jgi:hypothetical protein
VNPREILIKQGLLIPQDMPRLPAVVSDVACLRLRPGERAKFEAEAKARPRFSWSDGER